ncbi:hypothetical protein POUND7_006625 [Theobroma cacao]
MCCLLIRSFQLLYLLLFLLNFQAYLSSCSSSTTQLCSPEDAAALIQFKTSFSINKDSSEFCDEFDIKSYPKTNSWKEGSDCCSWDGITCDSIKGQVIGLDLSCSQLYGSIPSNSSLFHLPHLQKLNLAFNDFQFSEMSSKFGRFASLVYLNLSFVYVAGQVPSQISHLSKLVSLDLSWNYYLTLDKHTLEGLAQNLTEVRHIFLDGIDMSSNNPNALTNLSSSLSTLNLMYCDLRGKFPKNIFHLPNLKSLNLGDNINLTLYIPKLNRSSNLEILDLSGVVSCFQVVCYRGCPVFDLIIELFLLMRMALESSILSQPTFFSSRRSSPFMLFNRNLKYPSKFLSKTNHYPAPIISSFSNPEVFKAFGLRKTGIFGSQARLGLLSEDNEDVGNNQNLILVKRGILVAMVCSVLVFGCKRVFAVEGVVNAGYGVIGQCILLLRNSWPKLSMLLKANLSSSSSSITQLCSPEEAAALIQFKTSFSISEYSYWECGESYPMTNSWKEGSDCCSWDGVTCDNIKGQVIGLDLSCSQLNGSIPFNSSLFHLPHLQKPNLAFNYFNSAKMSSKFGYNENLALYLDLSGMSFSTKSIDSIGNLQSLKYLDLSWTSFLGGLPESITNLSSLEHLDASDSSFSGGLPNSIGNLVSLEYLSLSSSNLSGSISISLGNLSQLNYLDLSWNYFSGQIPSSLTKLRQLEFLDISNNQLEGSIPDEVAAFPNLISLNLSFNLINGTIPSWLFTASTLKFIALMHNQLNGDVKEFQYKSLEEISLEN